VLIVGRCSETIYRQRRSLANALRQAGWEVHLCGDPGDSRYITELANEGFPYHAVPLNQNARSLLATIRLVLAYRAVVRAIRPDVVHVFNSKPTIIGLIGSALTRRTARIATVAGLGHLFMAKSALTRAIGQGAYRSALWLADAVIFYNSDDRRVFIDRGLLPERKADLIRGSGIDLERFVPAPLPPGEQLEVLFIGRLLREKGITELIAAARELRGRGSQVRITIVGDVDAYNPSSLTRAEIDAAMEETAVWWIGPQHDIVPAIAASHVVLLPSHREGIPLALVEGGAMGRALVATDVPGCRDVVQHETNGLLVPLGDVPALVAALERLAGDRALVGCREPPSCDGV
jgi:glycosyltransferase involved in cell wall biosynthesis